MLFSIHKWKKHSYTNLVSMEMQEKSKLCYHVKEYLYKWQVVRKMMGWML
jgi:hypothetical protein